MPRPMINRPTSAQSNLNISTRHEPRTIVELTGVALEKRLRQKRSASYMEGMTKLDAGGISCSQAHIDKLKASIQSEFPDLSPYQYPIGIIARCYLGAPFEVHTLDVSKDIIKHYKKGEAVPILDRGRALALHPAYEFIEVYQDALRAVTKNGDIAIIKG